MLNTNEFNEALINAGAQSKFPSTCKHTTNTSPPPRSERPKKPGLHRNDTPGRSPIKPGARIQDPISHVAATRNQTASGPKPARKPEHVSKVANVATPSRYPPNTASKDHMSKIQCRACDKFWRYARECPNPSNKPMSERPHAYARAKSPAPDRRDPYTHPANVAIEKDSDKTYGWDNEDTGLGCMTVQTVPVPVGFNSNYLTNTLMNLLKVTYTLAPSLLDDGNAESHPGPITPMGAYVDKNEEHRMFNLSEGFSPYRSYEEHTYSDSDDAPNEGQESDYDVTSMTNPILTEHIVENLLNHMDTAQNEALKAEQASRGRAAKPVAYVRQMKPAEIQIAALDFNTDIDQNIVLRIAHASMIGPTVDPSFIDMSLYILTKLSVSARKITDSMKVWYSYS
jgi:hypothetical protein